MYAELLNDRFDHEPLARVSARRRLVEILAVFVARPKKRAISDQNLNILQHLAKNGAGNDKNTL